MTSGTLKLKKYILKLNDGFNNNYLKSFRKKTET